MRGRRDSNSHTLAWKADITEIASGTDTSTLTLTATETQTETATAIMTAIVAGTPTEEPPAPFESAYYTYDGDDNMVMSVINGVTTYYASSSYVVEVDGSDTTVRKTYSAGSTSLAVRTIVNETTETLNWLLSDHLGSSSITTTADGTWNSEIRYSAFGETRYSSGITPTDYRYTGQLEQADVNLYYYNARYYDAALGRFVQADSIVPGAGDSKSYDRYTYVNNSPCNFTDPSGHCISNAGVRMSEYPYGTSGTCSDYKYTPIKYADEVYPPDENYSTTEVILYTGFGSAMEIDNRFQMEPLKNILEQYGFSVTIKQTNYMDGEKVRLTNEMLEEMRNNPTTRYILVGFSAGGAVVGYIREQIMESSDIDTEQIARFVLMSPDASVYYNSDGSIYNTDVYFDNDDKDPNDIALRIDEDGSIGDYILVKDLLNSEFSGPNYSDDTLENIESNPDHFLLSVSYGVGRQITDWLLGR